MPPVENLNEPPEVLSDNIYSEPQGVIDALKAASTLGLGIEIRNYFLPAPPEGGVLHEAWSVRITSRPLEHDEIEPLE